MPGLWPDLTFVGQSPTRSDGIVILVKKYTDHIAQPALEKNTKTQIETMSGLQVIDSHGMIVGRVRKIIPAADTGDLRAFVLSVDKEQLKNLLDQRGQPREFELDMTRSPPSVTSYYSQKSSLQDPSHRHQNLLKILKPVRSDAESATLLFYLMRSTASNAGQASLTPTIVYYAELQILLKLFFCMSCGKQALLESVSFLLQGPLAGC